MKVIFECVQNHTSESFIEEVLKDTKLYFLVTCRCCICGRINRVKINRSKVPHQATDEIKQNPTSLKTK
tara:strand:- start:123 stop:329 length:207 start_codon:yes stop_codon:yes gene_type:complete